VRVVLLALDDEQDAPRRAQADPAAVHGPADQLDLSRGIGHVVPLSER
jgi:hypothetical protein